jgi:DNA-binding PadR family transcriptional regulator
MFDGGELKLLLLELVEAEPRHGYDLIRAIEELTGGAYAPSPGAVYPTLTLLKDMGYLREAEAEGARKLYTLTDEGRAHLAESRALVAGVRARLAELAAVRERTDAMPVHRAMNNLRTALMDKLSSGVSRETMLAAVALIDETAQKIERL